MDRLMIYILICLSAIVPAMPLLALWLLLPAQRHHGWQFSCGAALFAIYLCCVAAVTGLPTLYYGFGFAPTINLIPFHHFLQDTMQFLLNILMFIPLGIFLPLLWDRFQSLKETAGFGFLLSLLIEISQLFCYRTTDLNDLFMNTLGAVLGWVLWKRLLQKSFRISVSSPRWIVAIVWLSVFIGQGYLSEFLWMQLYH